MNTEGHHQYRLGIVGNCSYIAYIDVQAAVRWMCMPRFDSSFLFGSLLDADKGGEFSIRSPQDCSTQSVTLRTPTSSSRISTRAMGGSGSRTLRPGSISMIAIFDR